VLSISMLLMQRLINGGQDCSFACVRACPRRTLNTGLYTCKMSFRYEVASNERYACIVSELTENAGVENAGKDCSEHGKHFRVNRIMRST